MTIFTDSIVQRPRSLEEVGADYGDLFRSAFNAAFEENPFQSARRVDELTGAAEGEPTVIGLRGRGPVFVERSEPDSPMLSRDAALRRAAEARVVLDIPEEGVRERALDIMIDRNRKQRERQRLISQYEGSKIPSVLAAGLAASVIDPLNIASAFIPVVGPARYSNMLARAGGRAARAGVRLRVGALEGAVGAAIVEPLPLLAASQDQTDYDMGDSLLNVAFGTVLGGGLHATTGALFDRIDAGLTEGAAVPRNRDLSPEDAEIETEMVEIVSDLDAAEAAYAALPDTMGGKILNTDDARELAPSYRADRSRANAVHEPASWFTKQMYMRRLAEKSDKNVVVILSGGAGAGKSTSLKDPNMAALIDQTAKFIYDTNLAGFDSAKKKIDAALDSGHEVLILHTHRDPIEAFENGVIPRAMKAKEGGSRVVPLSAVEKSHKGSAATVQQVAESYADDPRVAVQVMDNSRGRNNQRLADLEVVRAVDYTDVGSVLARKLDSLYEDGKVSDAVFAATRGDVRASSPTDRASVGSGHAAPNPRERRAALRAAVAQSVSGEQVDVSPVLDGVPRAPEPRRIPDAPEPEPDIDLRAEIEALEARGLESPEITEAAQLQQDAAGYRRALDAAATCMLAQ